MALIERKAEGKESLDPEAAELSSLPRPPT